MIRVCPLRDVECHKPECINACTYDPKAQKAFLTKASRSAARDAAFDAMYEALELIINNGMINICSDPKCKVCPKIESAIAAADAVRDKTQSKEK